MKETAANPLIRCLHVCLIAIIALFVNGTSQEGTLEKIIGRSDFAGFVVAKYNPNMGPGYDAELTVVQSFKGHFENFPFRMSDINFELDKELLLMTTNDSRG